MLALALTALLVGVGRSLDLVASEEQYDTVQAAAQNADRQGGGGVSERGWHTCRAIWCDAAGLGL